MSELKLITSNQGKAIEIIALLEKSGIKATHMMVRYPEIRADDFEDVVKASIAHIRGSGLDDFMLDDSGLRIKGLNGFPGVYSAYVYKTVGCAGILRLLAGSRERSAEFVSVIGGCINGREFVVRGACNGAITMSQKGSFGFGYDPIFVPQGETRTFAEMPTDQKNAISHRGRAIAAFVELYEKGQRPENV